MFGGSMRSNRMVTVGFETKSSTEVGPANKACALMLEFGLRSGG